jgi:hypothetical protein
VILDALKAIPQWLLAIIAGLLVLLSIQTIRIDGLRLPLVGTIVAGLKHQNEDLHRQVKDLKVASELANAKAWLEKERREATNQRITERANDDINQLQDELERARAFAARNRVQPGACGDLSRPAASGEDRGSSVDGGGGGVPLVDGVLVSENDVMICTANTVKAKTWREWGLAISAATEE